MSSLLAKTTAETPSKRGSKRPSKSAAKAEIKSERLQLRLTRTQKNLIKQAADMQGRSIAEFIVKAASEEASLVMEQVEIIRLTPREQKKLAELLLNPPEPGPNLRAAARRYRELFGV